MSRRRTELPISDGVREVKVARFAEAKAALELDRVACEEPRPTSDIYRSSVRKAWDVLHAQARLTAQLAPRLSDAQRLQFEFALRFGGELSWYWNLESAMVAL